ncbi:hypothetical protein SESBI_45486 [Sesbania bispinosa]|nr:hypothetical protein SESBI_45486 [Sesbania bispinosa]
MELRNSGNLHYIQAIKGGLVTKVLNVSRGRPTLSFKEVPDICDSFAFNNKDVRAERSCISAVVDEDIVKTEPADGNDERINILDDDGFDNFTLNQIKERCKSRKRKHSQGPGSSKRKIKIEDSSSLEDCRKEQMEADDSDFMETLSSWRSKLSKKMKAKKKKCMKDPISSQEIVLVVSEEIQNGEESPPSSGDSAALVEVKVEVPETDCFYGSDDYSDIEGKEESEITLEWNLENELNYKWKEHADHIPLRMVRPCMDIVIIDSEQSSDQSPNFLAIEFEDHDSDIYDNQLDGDTEAPVSPPNVATHEGLECVGLEFRDDNAFLGDCSKDEFTAGAEVQAKPSSTIEHSQPEGCLVDRTDDSAEYEEKQSFASIYDDEKKHVNEATDELTSWDKLKGSPKLHRPERLLSTRKAISPSSQERLCKAMESVDLDHKSNLTCKGKLNFTEQTDKNGAAEGPNDIMGAGFTDNPNKTNVIPKTSKRVSKTPHSSRTATRVGCSSVQSCSKNAIAFSKQQLYDIECLAMKLTKELKSMKDIVDDMLRSEFCLNTSLRYKVNEVYLTIASVEEIIIKRG